MQPPALNRNFRIGRGAHSREWTVGSLPLYPTMLVGGFVIGAAASAAMPASWVLRPLAVAVLITAGITLIGWFIGRDGHWAAASTLIAVLFIAGFHAAGLTAVGAILFAVLLTKRREGRLDLPGLGGFTRTMNMLSGAWLVASVGLAMTSYGPRLNDPAITTLDGSNGRPNIYFLWLDGYARADALDQMGIDPRPFLAALENRDFDVATQSLGSYLGTSQTLAAMVQMRHLPYLEMAVPDSILDQKRRLRALQNQAPAFRDLQAAGYRIVAITSNGGQVTIDTVDREMDGGQVNEFEAKLIQDSEIDRVLALIAPTFLYQQHADRIYANLRHLEEVGGSARGPQFVLVHVMSPHVPFVFDGSGGVAEPLPCFPDACRLESGRPFDLGLADDEFARMYGRQVLDLNGLVLDALDTLIQADPDAIIIVMSDHGTRYSNTPNVDWYKTLFAARTPGHRDLFDQQASAARVFPPLFNAYFGADIEPMAPIQFIDSPSPLELVPFEQRAS